MADLSDSRPADSRPALAWATSVVGDRWSLLVVDALLGGARRFGEVLESVPGIATNVLSDRLRRLEGDGVIVSAAYSRRPPRYRYELTGRGRELTGVLRLLADWGAGRPDAGESSIHGRCGTPMEIRWWCPTCERTVAEEEGTDLHYI